MSKPRSLDLTGQVFGRLTVQERTGADKHGRVMWRCLCECGAEVVTAGKNLANGTSKSCGCYRRDVAPFNRPQARTRCMPGARFDKLTVVEAVGKKWGGALWRCVCDCGGTKDVAASTLRKGQAKSCGCLKPGPKPKPEAKRRQPRAEAAPKATRMSVKPERRTADGSNIGAWPKTAPKKTAGAACSKPAWRPQTDYKPLTAPAQRATGPVTVCPAPKFNHRYGVDPASVPRLFSAMRPGQYLEVAA